MSSGCVWYFFSELAVVVRTYERNLHYFVDFLIFSYTFTTNNSAVWIFNGWQLISVGFIQRYCGAIFSMNDN